jgi:hypothetical protein
MMRHFLSISLASMLAATTAAAAYEFERLDACGSAAFHGRHQACVEREIGNLQQRNAPKVPNSSCSNNS